MQKIVIFLTILVMAVMGPAVMVLSLPAASHGLVLVLGPPWADRARAIEGAGGRGIGPVTTIVASLAQADNPDFGSRMRAAGPFLVVDGQAVASLCGVSG
ncbi:hypothetical protein [Pseudooceanicola sediminis]|uniref:hypothetical protein n=1 Tax=Pseudooceanicola sediminis TaxID=2211117 RepID=UPI0013149244|nr:hypothetical protein [Pseudooceanicola sediminis]